MKASIVHTKSVYDPSEPGDGLRILVTRFHPRIKDFKKGVGYDLWIRDVSPDATILRAYKSKEIDAEKFSKLYLESLKSDAKTHIAASVLKRLAKKGKTMTLLCYEKEGDFCHRHVLREYLLKKPY